MAEIEKKMEKEIQHKTENELLQCEREKQERETV